MTYNPEVEARRRNRRTERYHTDPAYRLEVIARSCEYNRLNGRKRRDGLLKRKYGITLEQYEAMHRKQGGVCAICGQTETALHVRGGAKRLAVDHDAITGVVRGLLCQRCNLNIGQWNHSPERTTK